MRVGSGDYVWECIDYAGAWWAVFFSGVLGCGDGGMGELLFVF